MTQLEEKFMLGLLWDVFRFAQHQKEATHGIGYKMGMKRNLCTNYISDALAEEVF